MHGSRRGWDGNVAVRAIDSDYRQGIEPCGVGLRSAVGDGGTRLCTPTASVDDKPAARGFSRVALACDIPVPAARNADRTPETRFAGLRERDCEADARSAICATVALACDIPARPPPKRIMTIQTVFLDAGGVLVTPNWARVAETMGRHGVAVSAPTLASAELHAKRQLDAEFNGKLPAARSDGWSYFGLVLEHARVPHTAAVDEAFADLREYDARWNLWEHVPEGVVPALDRLRELRLTLVVVSNTNGTLKALLERIGLAPRVDLVIDSFEEGVEKPDPRLFRIAIDRAGARLESTVHVGDLYCVDVMGARAAGVRAVLLDAANLSPDADCVRIRSLGELADRLQDETLFRT